METDINNHSDDTTRIGDGRRGERRKAILDAAEELFLEQGFARVSLGAIVRRSGGSLATVYEMFGNKQGLLRAVVQRHKAAGMDGLLDLPDGQVPSETLRRYAHQCHSFATAPRSVALLRIVIGESLAHPEFGREFHEDMNSGAAAQLADCFRAWTEDGRAAIDNPDSAVQLFFAIVMCDAPLKTMLGVMPTETECGEIDWRLDAFLTMFRIV